MDESSEQYQTLACYSIIESVTGKVIAAVPIGVDAKGIANTLTTAANTTLLGNVPKTN